MNDLARVYALACVLDLVLERAAGNRGMNQAECADARFGTESILRLLEDCEGVVKGAAGLPGVAHRAVNLLEIESRQGGNGGRS